MSQSQSDLHCQPSTLSHPHFFGKAAISGSLFGPEHGIGDICSLLCEAYGEKAREEKGEKEKQEECAPELAVWGRQHPARLLLRPLATSPGSRLLQEMLHAEGQVAVCTVSQGWTEHWKNRPDPSDQLNFLLVGIEFRVFKKYMKSFSFSSVIVNEMKH